MKLVFVILIILFLCGCKSITRLTSEFVMPPNTVIFSFDDGPNPVDDTTVRLLEVLRKYEVKALFALFGDRSEDRPDLVRLIYNEGHTIINHGYSDKHSKKMNEEEFRDNLIRGGEAIFAALEKELDYKMYRPHGGIYNSRQLEICIEEASVPYPMFWVLTFDGNEINYNIKKIEDYKDLYEGLIILNGKYIIPEEMTTKTLFIIQNAISKIKQAREKEFRNSSPNIKQNEYYDKSIDYMENAIRIANELDDTESIIKK